MGGDRSPDAGAGALWPPARLDDARILNAIFYVLRGGIAWRLILQYSCFHLVHSTLSDALYQSAANPEPTRLLGQKEAYKVILCNQTVFAQTCLSTVKLEMQPLANVPTNATPIVGTTFNPDTTNDVLLLRSASEVVNILPMFPTLTVKASVIFRRPPP